MHASFNRICDPLCVSFGTLDHRRRQGMEKVKSHKVETRMIGANSTLVLWKSLIVEYRQVDPAHPVIEAGPSLCRRPGAAFHLSRLAVERHASHRRDSNLQVWF
jgi:hypothetical protein